MPDQRSVRAVKVLDPLTAVVTPTKQSDPLYGKDFVLHVNNIATPAEGDCGYDQALELSRETLVGRNWLVDYSTTRDGVYVDPKGEHHGYLNSNGAPYSQTMVAMGMAYVPTGIDSYLTRYEAEAKAAGAGLWATCPSFGL